jgi:hypothetical protein
VSLAEAAGQPHGFVAHGRTELDEAGKLPDRLVEAGTRLTHHDDVAIPRGRSVKACALVAQLGVAMGCWAHEPLGSGQQVSVLPAEIRSIGADGSGGSGQLHSPTDRASRHRRGAY